MNASFYPDYRQHIAVPFDYPVCFTRDLFDPANPLFANVLRRDNQHQRHKILFFVDDGVTRGHPALSDRICAYARHYHDTIDLLDRPHIVEGGEPVKNDYRRIMTVLDTILEYRMCRHSFAVIIGGGAVLDAVGFAASLVHRGIRVIRVPSTVLAQNDAGVGVKTGMNLHGVKNSIGTFHPPFAVLDDFALLSSLPDREWRAGIPEAFKVALIKDAAFFNELCRDAAMLRQRDMRAMERMIVRCARLHLDHIRTAGDPFETGRARPLDFGHWAAHKLESMSGYTLGHGPAVAIGIALDAFYASRMKWISDDDLARVVKGFLDCGLTLWCEELKQRRADGRLEILDGLDLFREHLGGELTLAMPDGIGAIRNIHVMDTALVEEGVCFLRNMVYPEQSADNRKNELC